MKDKLSFRRFDAEDFAAFAEIQGNMEVAKRNGRVISVMDLFHNYLNNENGFALIFDDAVIGCFALSKTSLTEALPFFNLYEVSFSLHPDFWGRGIGKTAARMLCEYAFSSLYADALVIGAFSDNMPSLGVIKSLCGRKLFSRKATDIEGEKRTEDIFLVTKKRMNA